MGVLEEVLQQSKITAALVQELARRKDVEIQEILRLARAIYALQGKSIMADEQVPAPDYTDAKLAAQIEESFTYHSPKGDQPERYVELREKAKETAVLVNRLVPNSREKSLAITNLEQSIMWANKGIACNE